MVLIKALFYVGPLLFAFGFLTPLFAALIRMAGLPLPHDLTPMTAALILAGLLGGVAQWRGRWI
jgi:hypothetical protein